MKKIKFYFLLNLPAFIMVTIFIAVSFVFMGLPDDYWSLKIVTLLGVLLLHAKLLSFPSTNFYNRLAREYHEFTGKHW